MSALRALAILGAWIIWRGIGWQVCQEQGYSLPIKPRNLKVKPAAVELLDEFLQPVAVHVSEFREPVVREQVRELVLVRGKRLVVNRHARYSEQLCREQPSVPGDDVSAAIRHDDWSAPPLVPDHLR